MNIQHRGMTLVEILVVAAVLATVSAVAAIYVTGATATASLAHARMTLASDLIYARSRAIATHRKVSIVFIPGASGAADRYELQSDGAAIDGPDNRSGTVTFGVSGATVPKARFAFSSGMTIGFDPLGQPFAVDAATAAEVQLAAAQSIAIRSISGNLQAAVSVQPFTGEVLAP